MRGRTSPCFNLLTQTQLGDEGTITLDVLLGQIVQQTAALTDHHLHTAAAVEVMGMDLQVRGQLVDTLGENCLLSTSPRPRDRAVARMP